MAALIDRVLKQDWGVRSVRAEVGKLSRGEAASPAIDEGPGARNEKDVPFKVNRKKVVIFISRLAQMNEAQKTELRSVLEPIWNELGGQTQPPPDTGFAHWTGGLRESGRYWKQMIRGCRELWRIFREHIVETLPPTPRQLPPVGQLPSKAGQFPSEASELPPSSAQAPSTAGQIPSNGKPVALLPTGKPEPGTKPGIANGSEHHLST